MTVKELIAKLQKQPEDIRVYFDGEIGMTEVDFVVLSEEARTEVTYKRTTHKQMALYNGEEIMVDVPMELPVYTPIPGVVIG